VDYIPEPSSRCRIIDFPCFLVFKRDFIIYIDIIRIAASNAATDDIINYVIHRVINTNNYIYYSCAHFILKIDEKSSTTNGFLYDLMMVLDSGLLFWATRYTLTVR